MPTVAEQISVINGYAAAGDHHLAYLYIADQIQSNPGWNQKLVRNYGDSLLNTPNYLL